MKPIVGFAVTGSFCTLHLSLKLMSALKERYDLVPIVSETVARTDTRFFPAAEYLEKVTAVCGRRPIASIVEAEPLGPNSPLDLLLICPCTGNTLSKIALGITDTSVTMACKAHRRQGRPVVLALSTNDGLSGSAPNLGALMGREGFSFVPLRQDAPQEKPFSLQFFPDAVEESVERVLKGERIFPKIGGGVQ